MKRTMKERKKDIQDCDTVLLEQDHLLVPIYYLNQWWPIVDWAT